MIRIKNVSTFDGKKRDFTFSSHQDQTIDGSHLTALPALFDPHVHFRTPGDAHKEDWKTASIAAVYGGVSFVCDMPNNQPSCTTVELLREKRNLIEKELRSVGIPLKFGLYLGADKHHIDEIAKAKDEAIGVKLFMGGSTGNLLVENIQDQEAVFREAGKAGMVVAVHAEDEELLQQRKKSYLTSDVSSHSIVRNDEVAKKAVGNAIDFATKYGTKLYLLHLSTKAELELVREAKKSGVKVFAETTPHHLFLSVDDYKTMGTLVQMNPPLRSRKEVEFVWEALLDGTIDTIGTDHAPHTLEEKKQPFGKAPSGIPGVDTYLALLLNAVHEKKLSLKRLVEVTRNNPMKLFGVPENDDWVFVDLHLEKTLQLSDVKTKCGWSPYLGRKLIGWPLYTALDGILFTHKRVEEKPQSSNCQCDTHLFPQENVSRGRQLDANH